MDEMIIPAAATREGLMQAAVTGGPEAEGDPEAEHPEVEAAGLLQRRGDQAGEGLAMVEPRTQRA